MHIILKISLGSGFRGIFRMDILTLKRCVKAKIGVSYKYIRSYIEEGNTKMKETDLRGKACAVAVAAGLGVAGVGLVSDGVVMADAATVMDTINVTVQPSCTFRGVENKTYVGSAVNGTEVNNFNDSGVHEFNLFCNNNNGYIVTAMPYDLEMTGIDDVIAYTDNYTHTGVNSMWTAAIATETADVTAISPVPIGGGTIISSDSSTTAAGASFTATYKAYVGSETPAGTYMGTIVYTLTASGASTDSGNNSSENTNSGNETTDHDETDNSEQGGSDANNSGPEDTNPGNTNSGEVNNTQNAPSPVLNNTYNTYNTTNAYNTSNYPSSGAGVSLAMNTQGATNAGDSNDLDNNSSKTDTSYEKPLGVITSTTSSNKESGIDLMSVAVAAGVLAVAGVAVVVLAKDKKEEEKK